MCRALREPSGRQWRVPSAQAADWLVHLCAEKTHRLKGESYVLFGRLSEDLSPGHGISDNAEKTVPKRQGGKPGYIEVFATKDQVVGTSKDYCQ